MQPLMRAESVPKRLVSLISQLRNHSRILSILLIVSILVVFGWQLVRGWHNLPVGFHSNVRWFRLLGSLAMLVPALLFVSSRWWLTLRAMGVRVGWWDAVRIWFLSQAGRYLPGGVWSYVGRFLLGRAKMTQETVIASMVLETGLRVVSEVLVFLLSLPFWSGADFLGTVSVPLLIGMVSLMLVVLHPSILGRLGRVSLLQRLGLDPIDLSGLRYRAVLALLAYYMLTVVMVGFAFYIMVGAFYALPGRMVPAVTGSLAASMVLGFLVPFVPNGWGVREGTLAFLLSQMMPFSVAIVISGAARIWLTLGELVWILVFACPWSPFTPRQAKTPG